MKLESEMQRLISDFSDLLAKHRAWNLTESEDFNLFRVLNIGHRETKLHTPLLRELFDAEGTHGQGALFFRTFLKQLHLKLGSRTFSTLDVLDYVQDQFDGSYKCRTEISDPDTGRMDLIIERVGKEPSFCIVIENKIYAREQENQLQRYGQYLVKHPAPPAQKHLVYLHALAHDHAPTTAGLDVAGRVIVMRYQDEICAMLRECLSRVEAPRLKEPLRQYVELIEAL